MVHQSTRCKKLQRVFYCNLSKKVQSGAPSGDENSSGPPPVRRAKTPQWGVFRARESPRWCTRKSRNECCGFFVAPFPPGRTHTSRKRSCSSRGDWSLNSVRRTEFLTRPLMVHQKKPQRILRLFCCTIPFGTDSHFAQAFVFVPRALYFLRTVCYGITVHGLPTIFIYYNYSSANSTTNLASVAAMASWSLFSKFVFCSILMTWYFTVDGSMPSSFAISL